MNDNKIRELLGKPLERAAKVSVKDEDERTIELSFSSENPIQDWPGMYTVLAHDTIDAADLSRLNNNGPFLFNHDRDAVLGVVEEATIDTKDRKGRATVRLGQGTRAEAAWKDIKDGILSHISVYFRMLEVRFESEDEKGEIYRALKWEPYEISLVSVPADISVGINRDLKIHKQIQKDTIPMDPENKHTEPGAPASTEPVKVDETAARDAGIASERERIKALHEAGEQFGERDLAQQHILENKSLAELKDAILAKRNAKQNAAVRSANEPLGLDKKEVKQYSFVRALRFLSQPQDKRFREEAAFEIECAESVSKKQGTERGFSVPVDVLSHPLVEAKRGTDIVGITDAAGYTGTGGALVDTTLLSSSFIELLRNRSFVLRRSTVLGGLVGDVDIPKELTSMATSWLGEDDPAPRSDVDFGTIALRNTTCAARGAITRKLLKQSSIDVEAIVRRSIAAAIALEIDRAGLYGSGQNNEPLGLTLTNNINAVTFAAAGKPTYAEVVDMETQVAEDNADFGSLIYALAARMCGHLKTTQKFAGTNGMPLWETGNTLNGYGTEVSNQVKPADLIYGNFAQLYAGMWGGIELQVDPYSDSDRGRINITAFQDADFEVARPESFVLGRSA